MRCKLVKPSDEKDTVDLLKNSFKSFSFKFKTCVSESIDSLEGTMVSDADIQRTVFLPLRHLHWHKDGQCGLDNIDADAKLSDDNDGDGDNDKELEEDDDDDNGAESVIFKLKSWLFTNNKFSSGVELNCCRWVNFDIGSICCFLLGNISIDVVTNCVSSSVVFVVVVLTSSFIIKW